MKILEISSIIYFSSLYITICPGFISLSFISYNAKNPGSFGSLTIISGRELSHLHPGGGFKSSIEGLNFL